MNVTAAHPLVQLVAMRVPVVALVALPHPTETVMSTAGQHDPASYILLTF
jgi:hypothetical protein